jgi:flagellar protein FlaI
VEDKMPNLQDLTINISPTIPPLPLIKDKTQVDVRYVLIAPYVSVHIFWNPKENELVYEIEEPILSAQQKDLFKKVEEAMIEVINIDVVVEKNQNAMIAYINKTAKMIIDELGFEVDEDSYRKIFYYLYRDFVGLNEIEPLIRDYFIEDIECNGAGTPIYIIHRAYKNIKSNIKFDSIDRLASFVEKLAQRCGKYISYASPIMDGTLPDGSRVNATYSQEITSRGPTFTIRKFTKIPWTPTQIISFRTMSPEMLAYLWILVQYRSNIIIAGGTASGKTTLLNALGFFIPPEARVVSIEDTRELALSRENWLPSVSRTSAGLGSVGEVSLFNLLKASFRQAPDYVIVGEVRGEEASVLFQGMASGHSSLSTIHADSVDTLIKRLETPPINLSPTLINTIDVVAIMTHAIVNRQETRKLREIVEVINVTPDGIAVTNTPFSWNARDDMFYFKKSSHAFEKISQRYGFTVEELEKEFKVRTLLLNEMARRRIFGFKEVQDIINHYFKDPDGVLKAFNISLPSAPVKEPQPTPA